MWLRFWHETSISMDFNPGIEINFACDLGQNTEVLGVSVTQLENVVFILPFPYL